MVISKSTNYITPNDHQYHASCCDPHYSLCGRYFEDGEWNDITVVQNTCFVCDIVVESDLDYCGLYPGCKNDS